MRFATTIAAAIAGLLSLSGLAYADVIPRGSYQSSCSDFYTDGTTLSATCRTRFGGNNFTTLRDYNDCTGDIANVNGHLRCVSDDDGDNGGWLPQGSYRDTCRRIAVDRDTLEAECQDRDGRWRYTELQNYRSCDGDIFNFNGMLRCRRDDDNGDGGDGGYGLPGGDWRYSCRDYRVYGFVLYASCRDGYGNWRDTSIDLRQCRGDVSNARGQLVCGSGGGYGRITLYRHANFVGTALTFTTSVSDLNRYNFGNVASSVVVQGGLWELCDRPKFGGQCIIVSRTQVNLRAYGFTDRAESVRRLH